MPRGGYREGAGKKPKWKHGKTKTIRVPEALADEILNYAKKLDKNNITSTKDNISTDALKIIDLNGISVKTLDGEMGVKLSDLVRKGYRIIPNHLYQIIIEAVESKNLWK